MKSHSLAMRDELDALVNTWIDREWSMQEGSATLIGYGMHLMKAGGWQTLEQLIATFRTAWPQIVATVDARLRWHRAIDVRPEPLPTETPTQTEQQTDSTTTERQDFGARYGGRFLHIELYVNTDEEPEHLAGRVARAARGIKRNAVTTTVAVHAAGRESLKAWNALRHIIEQGAKDPRRKPWDPEAE